jgi:hypothetical protein
VRTNLLKWSLMARSDFSSSIGRDREDLLNRIHLHTKSRESNDSGNDIRIAETINKPARIMTGNTPTSNEGLDVDLSYYLNGELPKNQSIALAVTFDLSPAP